MHAHLTRWQRFQVKAMAPTLWGTLAAALLATSYLAITAVSCYGERTPDNPRRT